MMIPVKETWSKTQYVLLVEFPSHINNTNTVHAFIVTIGLTNQYLKSITWHIIRVFKTKPQPPSPNLENTVLS